MEQESKPVASKEKHCGRQDEITPADDEIEEIEMPQKKTLYDKATQVMEKFASTRMGQMIIERTDRVLKVIEDTAKWSLPQDEQLERPLPWIFFLTLIVWLRGLRIGISVASIMVGSQRVTPESMVYYIQIKRRRLRAIRLSGLKAIHSREIEPTLMPSGSSGENVTLIGKLRNLLGSAICRPGQHREVPSRRVFIQDGKVKSSKVDMAERSSKRARDDESFDLNLTVDQMLDKYANEDSDADSDYVPKDDEDEDSGSTSYASSSTDETEKETTKKIDENSKESEKSSVSQNDYKSLEENEVEIKENGGRKKPTMPKPIIEIKIEHVSDVDSGNEQEETHKETANTIGSDESRQPTESGAATEADHTHQQQISLNTPKSALNKLAAPLLEEDKQKSTPGHESAASLKPVISTTAAAVNTPLPNDIRKERCYRTVTTQTSIEIDWSITFKTEVSLRKRPPKLEIINCSIPLTPATSTEDIFYSPIGSPQDFHSIFHPAPIIKSPSAEAHSTPKEEEHLHNENFTAANPESFAPNRKKYLHNLNHSKPYHHHHNAKNRNKNRR